MTPPRPLTPAQRTLAYAMTEDRGDDSLFANVCRIADDLGLYWHHQRNSIGSKRGWPDMVVVGPNGALLRELKAEKGRLTVDQRMVGGRLTAAGLDWSIWRPSDLLNGVIVRQLARIAFKEAA